MIYSFGQKFLFWQSFEDTISMEYVLGSCTPMWYYVIICYVINNDRHNNDRRKDQCIN